MSSRRRDLNLPAAEQAALNLVFGAWGAISCAHGSFHRRGVPNNPDGDPGMAALFLPILETEFAEHGQLVREVADQLGGHNTRARANI